MIASPFSSRPPGGGSFSDAREVVRFVRRHGRQMLAAHIRERRQPIDIARHRPVPHRWDEDRITVAWLGHATVLINFFGTWLLTDPALGPRVGVSLAWGTLGPRRLVQPALAPHDLPPLDAVLVSHAHMDHCDLWTLRQLVPAAGAFVHRGNGDLVRRFMPVTELRWQESASMGGVRIEAVPARHWGARAITDRHRGYGGFLIERHGRAVLFAGDTAYTPWFRTLRDRVRVDLAVLPIGGYDPYIHAHADPEQAWAMARDMGAAAVMPVHHSTFRLSREAPGEPIARLLAAAGSERDRVAITQVGETWVST